MRIATRPRIKSLPPQTKMQSTVTHMNVPRNDLARQPLRAACHSVEWEASTRSRPAECRPGLPWQTTATRRIPPCAVLEEDGGLVRSKIGPRATLSRETQTGEQPGAAPGPKKGEPCSRSRRRPQRKTPGCSIVLPVTVGAAVAVAAAAASLADEGLPSALAGLLTLFAAAVHRGLSASDPRHPDRSHVSPASSSSARSCCTDGPPRPSSPSSCS